MITSGRKLLTANAMQLLIASAWFVTLAPVAKAQNNSSGVSEFSLVEIQQIGEAPSGPHDVIVEHDSGLATHTIYRPSELSMDEHSVLVWGEGGCMNNGLMFPEYLSEIASHGFVVIADGPPGALGAGRPNGPGAGGPPPGPRPAGGLGEEGGEPGGPGPAAARGMVNGTDLIAAIDWLEAENSDRNSRFYNKVDVANVAAMGMSCGGLMSYGASDDSRVATVGIWNSGLIEADEELYNAISGSVIIVTGGESDIAYANGKRDFEDLPDNVPVFYGVFPSVGHGGTYNQDNGGPYGIAAVAWLKWQLQGDTSESGRGYFVGGDCGICADENWMIDSRSLR